MSYVPVGGYEKLTKRLKRAIRFLQNGGHVKYGPDDLNVFLYIQEQIKPEALKNRREDDTNPGRLYVAAVERLDHYDNEREAASGAEA